ncbi:MAG: hypothetical protein KAR44_04660 [Candidatus Aegiribacteria sp.]|nr:hypothetical protein [Candidatus Aegiribacteria sp.]
MNSMKTASLLALTLLIGLASAGMDALADITEKVTAAFDQETGTFAEGAYGTLLEAHNMIGVALEGEITDEIELKTLSAMDCMVMYNLACLEALDGNTDEAFTWLEGSVDAGYGDPEWMLADEDLAGLREDARFGELADAAAENMDEDCSGPCSSGGPCCGSGECE